MHKNREATNSRSGRESKCRKCEKKRTYMQFGAKATAKEEVRRVEARRNNRPKQLRKSLFTIRLDTGRVERKEESGWREEETEG